MSSLPDPESHQYQDPAFDDGMIPYIIAGVILIVVLLFLLFGTIATDLTCTRSLQDTVECQLVRQTPLQTMSAIRIVDPLAVDIIIDHGGKGATVYRDEIRSAHASYTLTLVSAYDYEVARSAARAVNSFLLSSDAPTFSQRFPKRTHRTYVDWFLDRRPPVPGVVTSAFKSETLASSSLTQRF